MSDLRDVFRYMPVTGTAQEHGRGDKPYELVNNTDLSDEDFYRQMQSLQPDGGSFNYQRTRGPDSQITNDFSIRSGSPLDRIQQQFGAVNFGASPYSENANGSRHLSIDASRMPGTRFGDISRVGAVDQGTDLINPSMAYDDPRYGRITPLTNIRGNPELEMGVKALMAAGTAGIGMLGAPAWASGMINAARGAGSGNWAGAAGSLLGLTGISPWLASALRMGMNYAQGQSQQSNRQQAYADAIRRRSRGGP